MSTENKFLIWATFIVTLPCLCAYFGAKLNHQNKLELLRNGATLIIKG